MPEVEQSDAASAGRSSERVAQESGKGRDDVARELAHRSDDLHPIYQYERALW
jgi:hypothetical protein